MAFRDLQDLANTTLFSTVHFGEPVTYTPAGLAAVPIDIVGAPAEEAVLTDGDPPTTSTRVKLRLRSDDVIGGVQARASVFWRGVSYRIESVDGPDDSGVCTCALMRSVNP